MSMRTYGGVLTGLIIEGDFMESFVNSYTAQHPNEFEGDPEDDMWDRLHMNDGFTPSEGNKPFYAEWYSDDPYYDTVAFIRVSDADRSEVDLPFILVSTDKWLATYNILEGKYYETLDELVTEFRRKVGSYLPDDFDYEANIGDIEYAIFC